jgi:ribosomal protein L7/L12
MNSEPELPEDVLAAIRANRKIGAIKLLRGHHNIGLKEAKEIVDAHMEQHPSSAGSRSQKAESGFAPLLYAGLVTGLLYAAYRFFS